MSSIPAGKRSWKCPECGQEVLLSTTQLDPIACDTCLSKMKSGGKAAAGNAITDAVAGPMGIWQGLPEITKLAAVAIALAIGFAGGYFVGSSGTGPTKPVKSHLPEKRSVHSDDPLPASDHSTDEESTSEGVAEERPAAQARVTSGYLVASGKMAHAERDIGQKIRDTKGRTHLLRSNVVCHRSILGTCKIRQFLMSHKHHNATVKTGRGPRSLNQAFSNPR